MESYEASSASAVFRLSLTLGSIEENLALDEALLLEAEAGRLGEVVRFWEWPHPAVVLGSGGKLRDEVDTQACKEAGVPILRRASGGGTVMLDSGCLCYSLVLSQQRSPMLTSIPTSYIYIFEHVCEAFRDCLPALRRAGTSDLVLGDKKVSGNAQQRKRTHVLHHGTLLYAFDSTAMGKYLKFPARRPGYRGLREHQEFLANIPLSVAELQTRVARAWNAIEELSSWPERQVEQLVTAKYSTREWIQRR